MASPVRTNIAGRLAPEPSGRAPGGVTMSRAEAVDRVEAFEAWRRAWRAESTGAGDGRDAGRGIPPASPSNSTAVPLRARGVAVARVRREAMRWLIRQDPERATEAAVPLHERADLPPEIVALLEEGVSGSGSLRVIVACPEPGEPPIALPGAGADGLTRRIVMDDGRRFDAFVFGHRRELTTRERISVQGWAIDGEMAVADSPLRETDPSAVLDIGADAPDRTPEGAGSDDGVFGSGEGEAASAVWTEGPKRVLYVRVRFSDDAPDAEPLSRAAAENHQSAVADYFRIASHGRVELTTTVTDVVTLPDTHASYRGQGLERMFDDALDGAHALGLATGQDWAPDGFDFLTVASRTGIGSYAGIAEVGGRRAHLQSFSLRTAGHEYGHNFGLPHAYYNYTTALDPAGQDPVDGATPSVEYGHRFSIMSAQSGSDFNNPALPILTMHEKSRLGWVAPGAVEFVEGAADTVVRLRRSDTLEEGGVMAVRVPASARGTNHSRCWFSYRGAWAPPHRSVRNVHLDTGAVADWTRESGGPSTQLDLTPFSVDGPHGSSAPYLRDNDDKWDAALTPGRTWSDGAAGVHVTCLGGGGAGEEKYLDLHVRVDGWQEDTLIGESDACRARVPDASTPTGTAWTLAGFDDSGWPIAGPLGIGYERGTGYESFIGTDVGNAMDGIASSLHVRIPFVVPDTAALQGVEQLVLRIRYDDGFVAYLNGIPVAQANAPSVLGWDAAATAGRPDSSAVEFAEFLINGGAALLVPGSNVLAIHAVNDGASSSDLLVQPTLVLRRRSAPNRPPTAELTASTPTAAPGESIEFAVSATDPDGDPLAFAWEFAGTGSLDQDPAWDSSVVARSWSFPGSYAVSVTVSDRRGGTVRDTIVVRIGDAGTDAGVVRGRILIDGLPLLDVRVWSGGIQTRSDSDGRYALTGLPDGDAVVRAAKDGFALVPLRPGPVQPASGPRDADFLAFESREEDASPPSLTLTPSAATLAPGGTLAFRALHWDPSVVEEEAVPWGAAWRFLDDGSDPGSAWREDGFDDSGWSIGNGPLGYGEQGLATEVGYGDDPADRHVTTWFRHTFTVEDASQVLAARLQLLRDDGAVVFLNGEEILRDNLPADGPIPHDRTARNDVSGSTESRPLTLAVPGGRLREGSNLLAVEIHQAATDSDDLRFDLRLAVRRHLRDVTDEAAWSTDGSAGSIANAVFSASSAGTSLVQAEWGGVSAHAAISVSGTPHPFTEWITSHFGPSDPEFLLPGTDADGDGVDQLGEFAFVHDPGVPDHRPGAELIAVDPATVAYRRIRGAGFGTVDWYEISGIRYRLEESLDGLAWVPVGDAAVMVGEAIDNGDGSETVVVVMEALSAGEGGALGGRRRLIRLRIEMLPVGGE